MSPTSVSCFPLLFILYGYLLAQFSLFSKSDYFVLRTYLSFICCYSLIFSIISMEWDLSFMWLGCMIWQGGRFLSEKSPWNVNSNPYSQCMGFVLTASPGFPRGSSGSYLKEPTLVCFSIFCHTYFILSHTLLHFVISYPQGILGYPQSISKLSTILS